MSSRTRSSLFKRLPAAKRPKKRFVLICEGANTEPEYFDQLQKSLDRTLIFVQIEGAAGTPDAIAKRAVSLVKARKKNSFESEDQVWAVFDRDAHHHYDNPIKQCEAAGVQVAKSNPCFELWLMLHIDDWDKSDDRHTMQSKLSSVFPSYSPKKRKSGDFSKLIPDLETAERRAERQCQRREDENNKHGAPSTTVYLLTRAIVAAEKEARETT